MSQSLVVLVLAPGKGTVPKPGKADKYHHLMGKSVIQLALDILFALKPREIHLIGEAERDGVFFHKPPPKHSPVQAVLLVKHVLQKKGVDDILVLNGFLPLLETKTLRKMLLAHRQEMNVLTVLSTPGDEDADTGVYLFRAKNLLQAAAKLSRSEVNSVPKLSQFVSALQSEKLRTGVFRTAVPEEGMQVRDGWEMARCREVLRRRKVNSLIRKGVRIYEPSTTWIDMDVRIGKDTVIYPYVIVVGESRIGEKCILHPFVHVIQSKLGDGARILSSTMIEESVLERDVQIGPFAHVRPQTVIRKGARIGNFVEMKNTVFGRKSKAGHFSYLGDTEVGEGVNIGAGTITCNYDGIEKHKTLIESGAFIGSGVELVAPVKVGKDSYVGAGSTITRDVRARSLAVERSRQWEKKDWSKKKRQKE